MNLVDIAAVIGALAWAPVIIEWVIKAIKKPVITVILDKAPEIGYTTFGPILNYRIALTADNGPVVISKIEIVLVHESGERRLLTWQGMVQNYGFMTIEDKKMPMERDQVALAIKVNDNDVEERLFRFQDENFNANWKVLMNKSVERLNIILNHNKDFHDELYKSDEIAKLRDQAMHGMTWKSGKYSAEIKINCNKPSRVIGNLFHFTLSTLDVERLKNNIAHAETAIKNEVYESQVGFQRQEILWNWQYPVTGKNG